MIQKGNATFLQRFPKDYFVSDIDRRKFLHETSSSALFRTHYVAKVICHKFSDGDVSYRFNGKNVKVMVELFIHLQYFKRVKHIFYHAAPYKA